MSEGRKTVTLNLGQAGGSPKQAMGTTKLKAQQGPLSKEFLKGFAKLLKMHTVRDKFDIALAVSKKKDQGPGKVGPRFMSSSRELGRHQDQLPGGLADKSKPSDFDPKELQMGIRVEREHVGTNLALAREIAMDHLKEDPHYYSKLRRVHKENESFFGDLTEEWAHLTERNRVKWKKTRKVKDIEEYGSQGRTAAQGGISDAGHSPPTLGFPSS
jgi:hypothetical protein